MVGDALSQKPLRSPQSLWARADAFVQKRTQHRKGILGVLLVALLFVLPRPHEIWTWFLDKMYGEQWFKSLTGGSPPSMPSIPEIPTLDAIWYPTLAAIAVLWTGFIATQMWRESRPRAVSVVSVPDISPWTIRDHGGAAWQLTHLGLVWLIQPDFERNYRWQAAPNDDEIDAWVFGPFCPQCGRNLVETMRDGYVRIEPTCRCGQRVDLAPLRGSLSIDDAKREVYKEAQRLALMGQRP